MISLDQEIRKDKERDRVQHRHRQDRNSQQFHSHRSRNHNHQDRHQRQQPRLIIKITNLHYSVTKEQLESICEQFGRIKSCRIEWDKLGRSNEKASVEYFEKDDANKAVLNIGQQVIEGQKIDATIQEYDRMPPKRHEIKKNYGNRYRQYNSNKHGGFRRH